MGDSSVYVVVNRDLETFRTSAESPEEAAVKAAEHWSKSGVVVVVKAVGPGAGQISTVTVRPLVAYEAEVIA
ncbi:MAG TPA: hypothetical protein VF377_08790 [Acidimicrobiia bacterium]